MAARRFAVIIGGETRTVELEELDDGRVRATIDGRPQELALRQERRSDGGQYSWVSGRTTVVARVDGLLPRLTVRVGASEVVAEVVDPQTLALAGVAARAPGRSAVPVTLRAPMPGRVVRVLTRTGDQVKVGQTLVIVEAMKMENEVRSPRAGEVRDVACVEGAAVEAGQPLLSLL